MKTEGLDNLTLAELRKIAKDMEIPNSQRMKKDALVVRIRQAEGEKEGVEIRGGILEIMNEKGLAFCGQIIKLVPKMFMYPRHNYDDMI
jgi:transcription termination factor Rho